MTLMLTSSARSAEKAPSGPGAIRFSRDIRPILADKCFRCHGPDEGQRKGKLRLDRPDDACKPAASGSIAIVSREPESSELIARILSDDPVEHMPPAKSGKTLTPHEVARLKQWISQGADYEQHWAFSAPFRPPVPAITDSKRARSPIDRFIAARLDSEKLATAPEADRITLIRRLSLDLIGLPPSIAEVDAFVADRRPDAYERAVDRLLASPHYGERWGRIWLDAARYADSDGYEKDKLRFVSAYRDWVISALNRDLPYDQFIIEQVAGDLLPGADQNAQVATGFLRNSMINEEGGIDPEQFRMEAMFDRMDCLGKSVLGLTIQCAQCHTHKYDPLTHEEYYKMFAFLNNSHESNIAVYTAAEQATRAEVFQEIAAIESDLKHRNPDWRERMAAWEKTVPPEPNWTVLEPEIEEESTGGERYYLQPDGSFLAQGYAPTKHTLLMSIKSPLKTITGFRLELLNDPNLPMRGPGRSIKGTGALTEFRVKIAPASNPRQETPIAFARATADVNPPETVLAKIFDDRSSRRRVTGPVSFAIDTKDETAWGFDVGPGRSNQPRKAVFETGTPLEIPADTLLHIEIVQNHGGWNSDDNQNMNLGRFRISVSGDRGLKADPLPSDVRRALKVPADQRTPSQIDTVFHYWRTTVPAWKPFNDRIDAAWSRYPEGTLQLVLNERDAKRNTKMLMRGDFLKPGKSVEPGVPSFLHSLPKDAPRTRLTFARWLVDRNAPTTARSIVNRVWQAYFGTGIVATSEDLGVQCDTPTHPDLLDWLAVEFMESGWSLKRLHRWIVLSSAYRQSSRTTPETLARDPDNRLLARGPRFRVDAEIVRDIALAASGRLYPTIGGPSSFPPAPMFLFQPPTSYGPKIWYEATGPDRYRRALYTFRYRSVPYPMLQSFDAPNGDFACVRRSRSNTPLQALVTLNEPVFLECARALALLTAREGGSCDRERMIYAFRRCISRPPTDPEIAALTRVLLRQTERFAQPGANPWSLAADDPKNPPALPPGFTPARLAGWTAVARVLLNLDETISKS
jgi:hypothetical protein